MVSRCRRVTLVCAILIIATVILMYTLSCTNSSSSQYNQSDIFIFEETCRHLTSFKPPIPNGRASQDSKLLFILVLSRPSALERRDAIRRSWMKAYAETKETNPNVMIKFSIGTKNLSKSLIIQLENEQQYHGDLLLLDSHKESYSSLSGKVLASFKLISLHYHFQYLLKCDDDTFVVIDVLVQELKQRSSTKSYYWGKIFNRQEVLTTGKFAEKRWFLSEKYLPYAIGAGYILSSDLVQYISLVSSRLILYHNEDVSVGVWISPYNMDRVHDSRVCENKPGLYYECRKSAVILHPISAQEMVSLQSLYTGKCKL